MLSMATKKKLIITLIVIICVASFFYWLYDEFYLSTDDAYLNANVVQVASRVEGQVQRLYIKNNQYVTAGQPLFDLDPAVYLATLAEQQALLAQAEAQLKIAELTSNRTIALVKRNVDSLQGGDEAIANFNSAAAKQKFAAASLAKAQLNVQYTHIIAPTSGWVTNVSLRTGDMVVENQPLFALISDEEFWVDANFKETDLSHISLGQTADITVDMYPGQHFAGVVESISGGSGSAFSLLPPENATGNWVKVTQRVPVRVKILNVNPRYPLRIGTSATVTLRISPWSKK